ncbi:MAG: hypothetical protein ACPGUV_05440 [Polyangiales bacterium]
MWAAVAACGSGGKAPRAQAVTAPAATRHAKRWRLPHLRAPAAVLHDTKSDVYLVSNVVGDPLAEDDRAFISRIAPSGRVLKARFIDARQPGVELNAPRGMAIVADVLFVADLRCVRRFDRVSGQPLGAIAVPGASLLTGLAVDAAGKVYVSDSALQQGRDGLQATGTDALYRLDKEERFVPLTATPTLAHPKGMVFHQGTLYVASFGAGQVLALSPKGELLATHQAPVGGLDGLVVSDKGEFWVSSWEASALLSLAPSGRFRARHEGLRSPAGIAFDARRGRLLVPHFTARALSVVSVPGSANANKASKERRGL